MTGPKTNEGATVVGERIGTRAVVRYVRGSASKARVVLDLIRGLEVGRADEVLRFSERDVAATIRKALASAVANAEHNDNQAPEELYVAACFADEGPTLKRFRPRARGRAGRIRKRTSHITIVVARLSEADLERKRRREEARPATPTRGRVRTAAASRRERVARSRQQRAAAAQEDLQGDDVTDETTTDLTDEPTDVAPTDDAPTAEDVVDTNAVIVDEEGIEPEALDAGVDPADATDADASERVDEHNDPIEKSDD